MIKVLLLPIHLDFLESNDWEMESNDWNQLSKCTLDAICDE